MYFEIIGEVTDIEVMAAGSGIRELPRLQKIYGRGRWRKIRGVALSESQVPLSAKQRFIGTKPMVLAKKSIKSNDSLNKSLE